MIKKLLILIILHSLASISTEFPKTVQAADAGRVLINEIQISGENANDEFIELYNTTSSPIDLSGWDLKKVTKTGTRENIVTNANGIIPASGYFLIIPRANCGNSKNETCYKGTVSQDEEYTTNNYLASDNTVELYDRSGNIIDKVGWGAAAVFDGEAFPENPEVKKSLERKDNTSNNKNDFFVQPVPNPQNMHYVPPLTQHGNENGENRNEDDSLKVDVKKQNENTNAPGGPSSVGSVSYENAPKIVITEFFPNPEDSDGDNEFIEVYNSGGQDADIGGWTIEDKTGKTKSYKIPENTRIKAGEYEIFMSSETKIILNNSGDGVILKNAVGMIQSETPISGAADEEMSFALDDYSAWSWTKKATPKKKNIIENDGENKSKTEKADEGNSKSQKVVDDESFDYADGIFISEIFPDPEGFDNKLNYEWIEIYNDSDKEIDLKGWAIDDIRGKGSKAHIITKNRIIAPKNYMVFSNEETKIILNNIEDEINVLWPDGTLVDSISYKKTKEGMSYAIDADGIWSWISAITPGKENVKNLQQDMNKMVMEKANSVENKIADKEDYGVNFDGSNEIIYAVKPQVLDYAETNVENARKLPRLSLVKISGLVSAPPGVFSENMFYIAGSGMQIYSYEKIFVGIKLGDKVELTGKMSEVGGEKRLIVDSPDYVKIISRDNLLSSKLISTGDVGEKYEGYLAIVEGEVAENAGSIFYIDDGSGKAKVYIKPETGIGIQSLKAGDAVNVTGIVSRTSLGYRILPRFSNDIKVGKTSSAILTDNIQADAKKTTEEKSIPAYYYGLLFAVLVTLAYWKIKRV